jgi:DNA-binding NtrC family response regulator
LFLRGSADFPGRIGEIVATPPPPEDLARDVLLVDGDPAVRAGLSAMLHEAGLQVTAVADLDRARDQLANRFFAVLLVDLDGPGQQAGLTLVGFAREQTPQTAVIVLSSRRTFEALAAAFRAGAFDVVPKTHESLPYLRTRILQALENLRASRSAARLLAQVSEVHERFLAQMVGLFRQVTELEERLATSGEDAPTFRAPLELLVVDVGPAFVEQLRQDCTVEAGFAIRFADSGGEALDQASQHTPDVLLINEDLQDLPASMVSKTVRTHSPEVLVALLRPPRGDTPGEIRLVDVSKGPSPGGIAFSTPADLTEVMQDFQSTIRQRGRERRHMIAFRKQHADFLRQYTELRQKLAEEN